MCDIPRHDSRSEEPNVLPAVVLGGLGADDCLLGLGVERLVAVEGGEQRARGDLVEFGFGRSAVVEEGGVDMGGDREDPCAGNGVEGEVAG